MLLRKGSGHLVEDPDWPGEYLLDIRTAAKRASIMTVLSRWMVQCRAKGFKAIEPDNLDSWTRSGGLLTQGQAVELAKLMVTRAHGLGLAIAQKNTSELARIGKSKIGFDIAIVEECQPFSECKAFTNAYGAQVYEIEYNDNGGIRGFNAACAARGSTISVTYRDRLVVAYGMRGYLFRYC